MASNKPTTKLTFSKTVVAELPVPKGNKPAVYWDTEKRGLGLRISPAGRRTFFLQARTRAGRGVKITIGTDRITPAQARVAAEKYLAAITLDRDPAAERRAKRDAERERRRQAKIEDEAATVADLWRAFQADHVVKLRPKSQDAYLTWYRLHVAPALGAVKLRDLSRGKIEVVLRAVAAGAGRSTANRVLAVVSAMLSYGEGATDAATGERRTFPDAMNVARGIKRCPEPGRERQFSDEELVRLIAYLEASPALEARLLELALATGARRGEMLGMVWSEISGSWWTIPAGRSKSRRKQRKPLSAAALAVLAKLDRRCDPFAGTSESRLSRWWLAARAELKLEDVHLHDLRHAAASLAVSAGVPLATIGAMLGHGVNSAAMTARYAHLADAQLMHAGDVVAERLQLLRDVRPAGNA